MATITLGSTPTKLSATVLGSADLEARELRRLESLTRYGLVDAEQAASLEGDFAGAVLDSREQTGAQIASLNIIGSTHLHPIACTAGPTPHGLDRHEGICGRILYATGAEDLFVTGDARLDPDLWDNPWVTGARGDIRFYAGAALIGREGLPLGMLCVFSTQSMSNLAAERAGARLVPIRDGIVAALEARRDAGWPLDDETLSDEYLASEIAQLVAAPRGAAIDAVIDEGAVRTLFQPIVHLETGSVAGFEALTRGPAGTELESPVALLDAARAVGRLGELDWVCRTSAMSAAARSGLPAEVSWFINVEPAGLEIDCPRHLHPALDQARADLRVVLEVVERDVEDHVTRLLHAGDEARRDAWGIVLDDVGARAGSLALLPLLQPDVVKLDMSLLREAPSETAGDVTAAVRAYAERTGAVILAEGIETPEQAELARIFGATYGQGYLYDRPSALPSSMPAPARPVPLRQRPAPISGSTPFEILQATLGTERGRPEHLRHIGVHLMRHCERAEAGAVMLALFDNDRGYLEHSERIDALAERNALTVCMVADSPLAATNPRHHVGPLPADSRLAEEYAMILLSPHFNGTLVMRRTHHKHSDGARLVDFIYTHDRNATIAAARVYLDHMLPSTITYPDTSRAVMDNKHTEQTHRTRVLTYLSDRLRPSAQPPGANFGSDNDVAVTFPQVG